MFRGFSAVLVPVLGFAFLISGCQKPVDQAADPNSPANSASGSAASAVDSAKEKVKSAVREAVAPKPLVIPADTPIVVTLDQTLSSKNSTAGQPFAATVSTPIEIDGKVAIPQGARASGIVKDAKAAGKFAGASVLSLTLSSVTVNGSAYDLQTSSPTMTHKGKGKRTAVAIGGGSAAGAIIGAIAGGGKGAAIGAAVGAGAGTGGAAFTGKADVTLPAETSLTFKLLAPVEIKQK